jgi:hypothetical protein
MRSGPPLVLFLENAPLKVERTVVLRIAFLPPEQTVIRSRLQNLHPQNIEDPAWTRRLAAVSSGHNRRTVHCAHPVIPVGTGIGV